MLYYLYDGHVCGGKKLRGWVRYNIDGSLCGIIERLCLPVVVAVYIYCKVKLN
jgi:hypothetical protein